MIYRLVKDVMERKKLLSLPPDTTVIEAARMMVLKKVGAVLIVKHERLVGIFTERDALFRVTACGLDTRSTLVAHVMTEDPHTVGPNMTYGYALVMMQENGFRHAPVVDGDRLIGIVSSRCAMDPELEDFVSESNRREHLRAGHTAGGRM